MKTSHHLPTVLLSVSVFVGSVTHSYSNYLYFDQITDSVQISGQTVLGTTMTLEAIVYFTAPSSSVPGASRNTVFIESQGDVGHKELEIATYQIAGYAYPNNLDNQFNVPITLSLYTWHDVAFVQDGTQERMYLDGQLVASRPSDGLDISESYNGAVLGAENLPFTGGLTSFTGYLSSLSISSAAEYTGTSYTPNYGKLTDDANTLLLYNFDEPVGSTTISDSSGHGRTGTFGTTFVGATSPEIVSAVPVPEPSSYIFVLLGVSALVYHKNLSLLQLRNWSIT